MREEVITEAIAEKLGRMAIRPEVFALLQQALLESNEEEVLSGKKNWKRSLTAKRR